MSVLELKQVSKVFSIEIGDYLVLDNIDLKVDENEIVGIVGPSGSGKTTILNIISKLLKPSKGEVIVNGKLGYMFQKDNFYLFQSQVM